MFKFIVGVSTIVSLALCASAFKIESGFNVASTADNMYIQPDGCSPTALHPFWNLNGCTLGNTCVVNRGSTVTSRLEFDPTKDLTNPIFRTTTIFNGMPFPTVTNTTTGIFPAAQRAIFARNFDVSPMAPLGSYTTTIIIESSDDPATVECVLTRFQIV